MSESMPVPVPVPVRKSLYEKRHIIEESKHLFSRLPSSEKEALRGGKEE